MAASVEIPSTEDVSVYASELAVRARNASRALGNSSGQQRNDWLKHAAQQLRCATAKLIDANGKDIDVAPSYGLNKAAIDRLTLTRDRVETIAKALEEVAQLPDPVGEVIDGGRRPNGLAIQKVRVPLGVVFFIYESRPNVTADAAALCVKSGNAVILRGGKEAYHSNCGIHAVLAESLRTCGLPPEAVQLVATTNRDVVGHLLKLSSLIDVTIPRGGRSLIERVVAEARMPVIKHFDGVCHVYVDASADLAMAGNIIVNSKTQRPGVCNAAETLLVHESVAKSFLPPVAEKLLQAGVELRGCDKTCRLVPAAKTATEADWGTEYLDLILSVKVVDSLQQAIDHIDRYGSKHTDAIVTRDLEAATQFTRQVDSAAVIVNASTRFNDGGEFGLGAEIGISTDKFHARGPCGLRELMSYKYIVHGSGQIRG